MRSKFRPTSLYNYTFLDMWTCDCHICLIIIRLHILGYQGPILIQGRNQYYHTLPVGETQCVNQMPDT